MNRYYMTADTRAALIAESKRLIAARADRQAARASRGPDTESGNEASFEAADDETAVPDSTFSRLVSDLGTTGPVPAVTWNRRRRTGDRRGGG